jgi:DNA-directed RNA polymerase subunit beta
VSVKIKPRIKLNPRVEDEIVDIPRLTQLQLDSFQKFVEKGIAEELKAVSPIRGFSNRYELYFSEKVKVDPPKHTPEECLRKEVTYSVSMTVPTKLVDTETGEVKKQDIYMGEVPCMTEHGTFIFNGDERVVVSQFVRSPGVYFKEKEDLKKRKKSFMATIIPNRGAWLEFEVDTNGIVYVYINKMKKIPLTLFLAALGYSEEEMYKLIINKESMDKTITKGGPVMTQKEALIEIHRKLRPGDHVTEEGAQLFLTNLFFKPDRYDLGYIGRYKMNKKLSIKVNPETQYLTNEDVIGVVNYMIKLTTDEGIIDDIDHLANRRIRAVGELMQKQLKVGLARLERLIKEQMMLKGNEDFMPQNLINIRPLIAVMNEFFGSSQLSQFMDQTNPLAELAHKRRLSAMGPGGLTKERAGFEVRDIHPSHYGRICPIETPEGPNAGLISPLATYSRVNEFGFIETPYRRVDGGKLTKKVEFLSAEGEDILRIAPYDFGVMDGSKLVGKVPVRYKKKFIMAEAEEVNYVGISPKQLFGISSCLVPFLEHDDANRALMGSNMMRQATPLVYPERARVGTGMEKPIGDNVSIALIAEEAGEIVSVDSNELIFKGDSGKKKTYRLAKFQRTNQNTCRTQKPRVIEGQRVKAGEPLVDGTCYKDGELALGKNVLVAFMPWEGYNFEDAMLVSERLVKDDIFTSIHITRFETDVRNTKLGEEEITPEIPNVSEEALRNLDERGIVRIGSTVTSGDILVGKVTPKGESEQPAEEKLLRAIFGDKARDMKDTSLRVTSGEGGKVVDVRVFSRENNDELPPGVNMIIRIYVAQLRKVMIGDKMAGRHGNKGVISRIMASEDMPFLPNGTPVDIVLNPLGVPSRMNVGQVYETILGIAAEALDEYIEAKQFDEAYEEEASVTAIQAKLKEAQKIKGYEWITMSGKVALRDGRTGELFEQHVMCGNMYMLKLIHLVEEKMHARATGPYSLITQQPLGGKAQFGGQRFGEMEVWALEAYGSAFTLQEMLTVKSDDVAGRARVYEAIIKGKNLPKPGTPESFRVLVRELRSLGLDMRVVSEDGIEIDNR